MNGINTKNQLKKKKKKTGRKGSSNGERDLGRDLERADPEGRMISNRTSQRGQGRERPASVIRLASESSHALRSRRVHIRG